MRILYISKHNPYSVSGGSTASRHFLEAFETVFKDARFDILLAEEAKSSVPQELKDTHNIVFVSNRNVYQRIFSFLTLKIHRYHKAAIELLKKNNYDLCIFDHSSIGGSLCSISSSMGVKSVVIHHNVERIFFKDNNSFLRRCLFGFAVYYNERKAYMVCDYNIFLTKEDMESFHKYYGKTRKRETALYIFQGRNDNKALPTNMKVGGKLTLIITGSLCNPQNIDGIVYFFDKIYPMLPDDVEIKVAGRNPTAYIKTIIKDLKNVQLIENPEKIDPIIVSGDIFVCPARLGSGIKVRITDGLRNGLPVLAHNISSQGYKAFIDKGYFIAFSNEDEFIRGLEIIKDKLNSEFKKEIRDFYKMETDFNKSVSLLSCFLCY